MLVEVEILKASDQLIYMYFLLNQPNRIKAGRRGKTGSDAHAIELFNVQGHIKPRKVCFEDSTGEIPPSMFPFCCPHSWGKEISTAGLC